MSTDTENPSIAQYLSKKADSAQDHDLKQDLKWIASEIYELERQLEKTTTIRRMSEALSANFSELLEKTFKALPGCDLHKREFAWFLYLNDQSKQNGVEGERSDLITMTVGGSSLRLRSGKNRTELDLNELDNFILKGHASKMQERIHEALQSVNNRIAITE